VLRERRAQWRSLGLPTEPVSFPNGGGYRVERMPLRDGFVTESMDGAPVAPVMGTLPDRDVGSLRMITFPNAWFHANSDYADSTQVVPVTPTLTRIRVTWLVAAHAREGVDYDPGRVTELWKATSEQDWELCENNQAGIQSSRYRPGPLSPITEQGLETFIRWYFRQLEK